MKKTKELYMDNTERDLWDSSLNPITMKRPCYTGGGHKVWWNYMAWDNKESRDTVEKYLNR